VNWRSFTEEFLDSTGIFRDAIIAILAAIARQERIRRPERAVAAARNPTRGCVCTKGGKTQND
jgi:hypothetical protein